MLKVLLLLCFLTFYCVLSAPVAKRMVDMTYVFDETTLNYPTVKKFEMELKLNETVEEGYWLQLEEYSSATHVGTHMDAPCHFVKGRWSIDQIPVSRLIAPAAVVDITNKAEMNVDAEVEIEDLQRFEEQTGHMLNDVILLIRSGWGERWSNRTAFIGTSDNDPTKLHFPGLSPNAAQWLIDNRNIYGLGTEALSLDYGPSNDFRTHRTLLNKNIFGIENMANMADIPIYGATLHVMPMKIGRSSGAPTRVVATFPDVIFPERSRSITERSLREVIIFG